MNDNLEREVEDALARLARRAVPDSARPPAPPWQQRPSRRVVDPRRFGRATPWLVAAVLLVIAGLGIGAAVTFDASAPDRGPVGTEVPSPTGTVTAPDGTLGTAASTPSSHPTLSRDPNATGPDDGVNAYGPFQIGVGSYGPIQAGMTTAEVLAAIGGTQQDVTAGPSCFSMISLVQPDSALGGLPVVYIETKTDHVVHIDPSASALDPHGLGVGSTLAALRAAYPDGSGSYSSSGWVFSVRSADGARGTAFVLSTQGNQTSTPAGTDTVTSVIIGDTTAANGGELYAEC